MYAKPKENTLYDNGFWDIHVDRHNWIKATHN